MSFETTPGALIAPGGAVLALAADGRGELWLATESGLWHGAPGAWRPATTQPPLPRIDALLALTSSSTAPPLLIAGGAPGALVYSLDGGATWHAARTDEVETPISCLVASPRFAEDRTLLAGTAGAGILRSTDGGRSWRLSNAGLQEFVVLALAVAPAWDERELAFAVTEGGLYQSPNAGRYWRRVADCGDALPLQALAVSSAFAEDGTVFAGGDLPGVARSRDAGRSWTTISPSGDAPTGVNCLLAVGELPALLAGTFDGAIYRSDDGGAGWQPVAAGHSSVLALGPLDNSLAAGTLDEGLLLSHDGGRTWAPEPGLGLRDLTRLAVTTEGSPLAFGPTGGVWRADGMAWQRVTAELAPPLIALLARADASLLVATAEELVSLAPGGPAMEPLPGGVPATTLAAWGGAEWLGDANGVIWRRAAGGDPWLRVTTIAAGLPVAALTPTGELGIVAATSDVRAGRATLWRSAGGGAAWERWLELPAQAPRVLLCAGEPFAAAAGAQVWRQDGSTWHAAEPDGQPVVALLRAPGGLVAATTGGVYHSSGDGWESVELEPPPGGLLDLIALPSGQLLGLGRGGRVITGTLP